MSDWTSRRVEWLSPRWATVVLTALAYGLVGATFGGLLPWYPELDRSAIDLLSHAIAVVNTTAVVLLLVGWYHIRHDRVRPHAASMLTAVGLIVLFLVLYLLKIGGGGQREIVGAEGAVLAAYQLMLAVHIILSILAVPLVVYVVSLAISRPVADVYVSSHARVGRVAVGTWLVSLTLGVITYLLLNHVYEARLMG